MVQSHSVMKHCLHILKEFLYYRLISSKTDTVFMFRRHIDGASIIPSLLSIFAVTIATQHTSKLTVNSFLVVYNYGTKETMGLYT